MTDDTLEGSAETTIDNLAKSQPRQFMAAVQFLRVILYHESVEPKQRPIPDADWERKVLALSMNEEARSSIKGNVRKNVPPHPRLLLLHAAFRLMTMELGEGSDFFIEFYSLTGDIIPPSRLPTYIQELEAPIFSNKASTRNMAARASGIIVSLAESSGLAIKSFIDMTFQAVRSWEAATGADINRAHGALLTLAYTISRLSQRESLNQKWRDLVLQLLQFALPMLKSADKTIKEASYLALGQLSMFHVLSPSLLKDLSLDPAPSYPDTADLIYESGKSGNEKAITALGRFGMIAEEDSDDVKKVIERLHSLHEVKQMESQFAVGEALSCVAAGWNSKAMNSELDIDGSLPSGPARKSTLVQITDKTIQDCKASKPSLRKASVIWLLCLLEYCGHNHELHERLPQCQQAFKRCLSDKDELVQEAASRGLGLVYEKGDRELKEALVRDLVASFSDNKPQLIGNVTADTELFEPGALPTGEGSSVTTYKDILNLASEVGDSSLVYRFMSMASSSAIWSSRAAFGRFGLSNVFAEAKVDDKLVVKLYRYRFDPNPYVSGRYLSLNFLIYTNCE